MHTKLNALDIIKQMNAERKHKFKREKYKCRIWQSGGNCDSSYELQDRDLVQVVGRRMLLNQQKEVGKKIDEQKRGVDVRDL